MLRTEFAAPVLRGRPVAVAIDGDCRVVQIVPPTFQGWAVGRLISPNAGIVIREADAVERQMLLGQWPTASVQICHSNASGVLAVPLFSEALSVVRLHLCDDAVASNDVVMARFDGRQYWFDRIVARNCEMACLDTVSAAVALPDLCTATFATNLALNDEFVH